MYITKHELDSLTPKLEDGYQADAVVPFPGIHLSSG